MVGKPKAAAKKKQAASTETSQSIEEQTKAFLENGGAITQINTGVSGQVSMAGPKHISLGSKPRETQPVSQPATQPEPASQPANAE